MFHYTNQPGWLAKYQQGLQDEESDDALRQQLMSTKNPKDILRNYFAQQTIEQAENDNYDEPKNPLKYLTNLLMSK